MNNRKSAIALYRAQPRFSLFSEKILEINGIDIPWKSHTHAYFVYYSYYY